MKTWYEENKERLSEYKKDWYQKNKIKILQDRKKYREENKEKCYSKTKEWSAKNKDKIKISITKWINGNKDRIAKNRKEYIKKNKEKIKANSRNKHLKRMYGITTDDYNRLCDAQENRCAICGELASQENKLHVDHSHKDGNVRGLLCGNCNRAIGIMKDDVSLLQKAINYLSGV